MRSNLAITSSFEVGEGSTTLDELNIFLIQDMIKLASGPFLIALSTPLHSKTSSHHVFY